MILVAVCLTLVMFTVGCGKVQEGVGFLRGIEEYVYGYPLVMMDVTRAVMTATPNSGEYSAPIDQFARLRTVVSPDFKNVVRISVNSLWTHGFLDLQKEPMIVTIPDTQGRYIVVQGLNMWTDVFASVGTRTPETKAGNFLIAGPNWNGTPPPDVKAVFRCSTRYAWVLVQISAGGPQDYPAIHKLQDQIQATPLSSWGKPYTPPKNVPVDPTADITATPYDQVRLMTGEMFFTRLAAALKDNPPYPADTKALERLKKIGIEPGKDFDAGKLDPDTLKGINKVPGVVALKFATGPYDMKAVNGWINILNLGRYGTDYETRAFIAYFGLGALTSDDAVYPTAVLDGDGKVLDGAQKYVMHFEKNGVPPSYVGVWSISPYRENFYVRNPMERYGLLSGMPLKYNADGSLDVYIQAKSPGPDKEVNWLPTPQSGPFNLTIRAYQPKKEFLDGTYKLPPVKKVL